VTTYLLPELREWCRRYLPTANVAILAAMLLVASAAAQTRHPQAQLIVRPIGATAVLQVHPAQVRTGREFESIASRLRNRKQTGAFGVLDGSPEDVIGGVTGASIDASNRVYILDEQNSRVTVLTPQGSRLATIGRSGRGPEEFFHPRALTVTPGGTIHVGDLTLRMQKWRPSGSSCTSSGRPMWVTELAGKMPPNVEENSGGGITVRIEESGFQRVESLTGLGSEYLLLQLAVFTAENRRNKEPYERLDSFVLRVSDGRGEWIGNNLPKIVAATGGVLVAAEEDPFPRVLIYRY
jgi:hypothetical protein